MLYIEKENSAFLRLETDEPSVLRHISDEFVFEIPNYKFTRAYKLGNKKWNGEIRLLKKNKFLYSGLIHILENFLKQNNYDYINNFTDKNSILFTIEDIRKHIVSLNFDKLSTPLEIRDYH